MSAAPSTTLAVPPSEAKAAWLQYAWEEGGGLPLVASILLTAAPSLRIDVHLYTMSPEAHVRAVCEAGADRVDQGQVRQAL